MRNSLFIISVVLWKSSFFSFSFSFNSRERNFFIIIIIDGVSLLSMVCARDVYQVFVVVFVLNEPQRPMNRHRRTQIQNQSQTTSRCTSRHFNIADFVCIFFFFIVFIFVDNDDVFSVCVYEGWRDTVRMIWTQNVWVKEKFLVNCARSYSLVCMRGKGVLSSTCRL